MAVSKFLTSRLSSKIWYSSLLAGNQQFLGNRGAYDSIATTTLSTTTASVTFSSIPSTYTHLQIRYIARANAAVAGVLIRINSDTGTNYSSHSIGGEGATAFAGGSATIASPLLGYIATSNYGSDIFGAGVADILDYANTNKYKSIRTLSGVDNNGAGYIGLLSDLWQNTSAVSTITLVPQSSASFVANSSFALYGIKGV
jgi:hypothetical protein